MDAFDPLRVLCGTALDTLDSAEAKLAEADALMRQAILAAQHKAFAAECQFLLTAGRPSDCAELPAGGSLAFGALLSNAPTLSDCTMLLRASTLPATHIAEVRYSLCAYLRGVRWPTDAKADILELANLAHEQPGLVNSEVYT